MHALTTLSKDHGVTVAFVTHDPDQHDESTFEPSGWQNYRGKSLMLRSIKIGFFLAFRTFRRGHKGLLLTPILVMIITYINLLFIPWHHSRCSGCK